MQTQASSPDYLALVIEWDDADEPTLVREQDRSVPALIQVASVALAGLGAIALAAWGIHRLRAAPAM